MVKFSRRESEVCPLGKLLPLFISATTFITIVIPVYLNKIQPEQSEWSVSQKKIHSTTAYAFARYDNRDTRSKLQKRPITLTTRSSGTLASNVRLGLTFFRSYRNRYSFPHHNYTCYPREFYGACSNRLRGYTYIP